MNLTEKINNDLKVAMKAKDKKSLQAIRAIKSAIIIAKTETGASDINEAAELKILQKLVKQRRDSATIYKEQNRPELYEQEEFEAIVISKYLPEQMSDEELTTEIKKIIEATGATTMKDMGKVMGIASKQLAGKTDGRAISSKVKELLGL